MIKIEPQAIVQQSVTMFPVLVAIENVKGELLPGMNGEVTIDIARRTQVVAVPLDAVRSMRELPTVATTLGLNADSLRAQVQRQMGASTPERVTGFPTVPALAGAGSGGAGQGAGGRVATGLGASGAQIVRWCRLPRASQPRLVRLGIGDFDYAEVLSGVKEGDVVVLLSVAEQATKRKQQQAQLAQRMGNGLPGSTGTSGCAGRASGGGR